MQIVIELLGAHGGSFMKHLIYIEGEINPINMIDENLYDRLIRGLDSPYLSVVLCQSTSS